MRRLTCCLWGGTKCWKTSFALGWPGPIDFFDWNLGLEGVIEDLPGGHDHIKITTYQRTLFGDHDARKAVLDRFRQDYQRAINAAAKRPLDANGCRGTIVVDTATELEDLVQSVTLEDIRIYKYNNRKSSDEFQAIARDYGPRNEFMEGVVTSPLGVPGLNAVFIHKDAAVWAKNPATGQMEDTGRTRLAGWKRTPIETQITIEAFRSSPKEDPQGRLYNCRLGKASKSAEGLVLAELSYEFLSGIIGGE